MPIPRLSPYLSGVHCFACGASHDPHVLLSVCTQCAMPLRVDYDLTAARLTLADLASRPPTMWRYREVLPLVEGDETSLAEGFTPLLQVGANVWVKDEARNPTGSFKARGMALAVSMAKHLGAKALTVPSAGNAAGALAAYGARAGLPVTVAMPEDTPRSFFNSTVLIKETPPVCSCSATRAQWKASCDQAAERERHRRDRGWDVPLHGRQTLAGGSFRVR